MRGVRGGIMQICKLCGSLMRPEKKNGSVVFVCNNGCGVQKAKKTDSMKLSEKIEHDPLDNIHVIDPTKWMSGQISFELWMITQMCNHLVINKTGIGIQILFCRYPFLTRLKHP